MDMVAKLQKIIHFQEPMRMEKKLMDFCNGIYKIQNMSSHMKGPLLTIYFKVLVL